MVYAIEATCHACSREKAYGEAFRVLKPGGMFAVYEWAMNDKYNDSNPEHKQVKEDVEVVYCGCDIQASYMISIVAGG